MEKYRQQFEHPEQFVRIAGKILAVRQPVPCLLYTSATGVKQGVSPKRENPRQENPRQAKPEQAEPEQENPAQLNTNPQRTKKSKTDISRTHQSIYPAGRQDGIDRMDMAETYREIIKENVEYRCV